MCVDMRKMEIISLRLMSGSKKDRLLVVLWEEKFLYPISLRITM